MKSEIPAHEQFGYDVVERALSGGSLQGWENEFARLFWQSLEVHNGGFEQWIGNTGKEGVFDTLEALERHSFDSVLQITKEAIEIVKLTEWDEEVGLFDYLEARIQNWPERLRILDERYWGEADRLDAGLQALYRANTEPSGAVNDLPATPPDRH